MNVTAESSMPMRQAIGEALVECGGKHPDIVVLDADTSSSTLTKYFAAAYPERFFNVGISEANMVSIAAGLSLAGKIPFVASFAFLLALRSGDQIRSQIAYGNLNVKLLGGYCGLSDFADGASHQSIMDLAVMRALPNMTVVCCADITEAQQMIAATADHQGPAYIRVSRAECKRLFKEGLHPFQIGKAIRLQEGSDLTLIATGSMVAAAIEAADALKRAGIQPEVLEVHTLKPFDTQSIVDSAAKTGKIVTCEEHSLIGGLFSAVSEVVVRHDPVPVVPVAVADRFGQSGSYADLLAEYRLRSQDIVDAAISLLD